MQLTDEREIAADPAKVWDCLTDPEVLRRCIPGCQELSGSLEDGYQATVVQKVGPVKATFKGEVTLSEVVEGVSCKITGQGKGGPAGFAKGSADVALAPNGEGTRLSYDVEAKVGGKLAQLGGRVIDGFARKMSDQFFDNFKAEAESGGASAGPLTAAPDGSGAQSVDPSADATAAKPAAPAPNAAPDSGGTAAPRSGGAGDVAAPPSSPDEDQTSEEKKGWFKRLTSR